MTVFCSNCGIESRIAAPSAVDDPVRAVEIHDGLADIGWAEIFGALLCIGCQVERAKRPQPDRLRLFMNHCAAKLAPDVVEIRFRESETYDGTPALLVGVVISDECGASRDFNRMNGHRLIIQEYLNTLGDKRFAYIHHSTVSEAASCPKDKHWF